MPSMKLLGDDNNNKEEDNQRETEVKRDQRVWLKPCREKNLSDPRLVFLCSPLEDVAVQRSQHLVMDASDYVMGGGLSPFKHYGIYSHLRIRIRVSPDRRISPGSSDHSYHARSAGFARNSARSAWWEMYYLYSHRYAKRLS